MLRNAVLFALSALALVGFAPQLLPLLAPPPSAPAPTAAVPAAPSPPAPVQPASADHEVSLSPDRAGGYRADALLDGQPVAMVVDTGASFVTISAATAERLGLHPLIGEPALRFQTANGVIAARPALLSTLAVGPLYMTDVRAYVLDPAAGEVNLLGMDFLKRLVSVEQRDGWLFLRQ